MLSWSLVACKGKGGGSVAAECTTMVSALHAKDVAADKFDPMNEASMQPAIAEFENTTMLQNTKFHDPALVDYQKKAVAQFATIVVGLKEIATLVPKSNAFDRNKKSQTPETRAANERLSKLAGDVSKQVDQASKLSSEVRAYCAKQR
jgi:hypothetical protein